MESSFATTAVAAGTLLGTAVVIHFSPHSWSGLKAAGPWLTATGACLPPIIYVLSTYRDSDNPAVWSAYGVGSAVLAGIIGILIGLFLPPTWRWWNYLLLGISPWIVAGAIFALGAKSRHERH